MFPGSGTCAQNPRTGKALADWVVADSKGKPVNVLMQSMPVYNVYIGFRDGFRAELKRLCPACTATIQETTLTQFAAGQIPSALVNTLRQAYGITLAEVEDTVETVLASPSEAALLEVETGLPMLLVHRLARDASGRPVEWTRSVFRGDRFRFLARSRLGT